MVIFNSYVTNYQRVMICHEISDVVCFLFSICSDFPVGLFQRMVPLVWEHASSLDSGTWLTWTSSTCTDGFGMFWNAYSMFYLSQILDCLSDSGCYHGWWENPAGVVLMVSQRFPMHCRRWRSKLWTKRHRKRSRSRLIEKHGSAHQKLQPEESNAQNLWWFMVIQAYTLIFHMSEKNIATSQRARRKSR